MKLLEESKTIELPMFAGTSKRMNAANVRLYWIMINTIKEGFKEPIK